MDRDQTPNTPDAQIGGGTLPTWRHQPSAGKHDYLVYDEATGRDVAIVLDFNEANARLIAKAPQMRAFLEQFIRADEGRLLFGPLLHDDARALLAQIGED